MSAHALLYFSAGLVLTLLLVAMSLYVVYQPDRPIPIILPGTSVGPAMAVQLIRPRSGLPLGGILPPELFGVDEALGFNSEVCVVRYLRVEAGRLEVSACRWDLVLVYESNGRVTEETVIEFDLKMHDRIRRVRCRPDANSEGTVQTVSLSGGTEVAGRFSFELAVCEDAHSGKRMSWPPRPILLRGSFDRIALKASSISE